MLIAALGLVLLLVPQQYVSGAPPTPNVNVINTPLTIDGVVDVANTPDVNVANTPDVNIANTPLLVEEAAVEPFLVSRRVQLNNNNATDDFQLVIPIPEGKVVIVEYVSADVCCDEIQQNETFQLYVLAGTGSELPRHYVAKLTRFDGLTRIGSHFIRHAGGGPVTTYGVSPWPSINISVQSNIGVGKWPQDPRNLFADIQLSGRLVNAE
jgi:hypothetical protein